MNSCRTGNHYCSNCNAFLGAYNPGAERSRSRNRTERTTRTDRSVSAETPNGSTDRNSNRPGRRRRRR